MLEELNQALNSAESIQFPSNIEVVEKYYDKIDVTTIAAHDGNGAHLAQLVYSCTGIRGNGVEQLLK
ncbi:MAG: hypothetical protein WAN75_51070 [Xanthobacteraceae bacterium]